MVLEEVKRRVVVRRGRMASGLRSMTDAIRPTLGSHASTHQQVSLTQLHAIAEYQPWAGFSGEAALPPRIRPLRKAHGNGNDMTANGCMPMGTE